MEGREVEGGRLCAMKSEFTGPLFSRDRFIKRERAVCFFVWRLLQNVRQPNPPPTPTPPPPPPPLLDSSEAKGQELTAEVTLGHRQTQRVAF